MEVGITKFRVHLNVLQHLWGKWLGTRRFVIATFLRVLHRLCIWNLATKKRESIRIRPIYLPFVKFRLRILSCSLWRRARRHRAEHCRGSFPGFASHFRSPGHCAHQQFPVQLVPNVSLEPSYYAWKLGSMGIFIRVRELEWRSIGKIWGFGKSVNSGLR